MAGSGTIVEGGSDRKPRLSFWQIWNMSFGFLGIQFGFGLQNANVSRIFQTLGAEMDDIPILWIAAPLTGLLIQPIVGFLSDNTWHPKYGRRRPFFLIGALLASAALIFMPNSWELWVAAGTLWIMDASINISMEPFRAFVGDMLPASQRTEGFAMQSFFIGTGAVIASLLPFILSALGVSNQAPEGEISPSLTWSFYIGGAVFLGAVLWTVFSSKEYPPEVLEAYEAQEDAEYDKLKKETKTEVSDINLFITGSIWLFVGALLTYLKWAFAFGKKELYLMTIGVGAFGLVLILAGLLKRLKKDTGFNEVIDKMLLMPKTMAQLAIVQFFSWFALFSMWIYTTGAVTEGIFGTTDTTSKLYNDGGDWVGVCFAVYNGVAALVAFLLPVLAKKIGRKKTHLTALVMGGLGLISIFFIKDQYLLLASMVGVGVAWASILSMPYAILSGALPAKSMGLYMGIFNFFVVIPQLVAASILGYIVGSVFEGKAVYALLIGGVSMIIAGILTLAVDDEDEKRMKLTEKDNLTNYFNKK